MALAVATQVGTKFLSDSAKAMLGIIISRISEEIQLAVGFKDDLRDLQCKLKSLDAILSGAQPGSIETNAFLDVWLNKVREVAYQAEAVVNEYSNVLLRRRTALMNRPQRLKTKIRFFFSVSSNPLVFRLRMAHKVRSVKESIDKIYYEAQQQGIRPVEVSAVANAPARNHDYDNFQLEDPILRIQRERPDHTTIIGRVDDKNNIMKLLRDASNSDKLLTVVGISGMAGLGKTTLCRNIFDLDDTKKHFAERIWICVSHDFNFVRLLNSMVGSLEKCESHISEIATLELKLQDKLREKKYLLVLDDIWETFLPLWESMRSCLQTLGGVNGSTILVTSRNEKVLLQLKTHSSNPGRVFYDPCIIYKPNTLGAEDSELLFKQLLGDDLSGPMKVLAKGMLEKCSGLPLAIKTLGGLLATQKEIKTWRAIESNGIWNLEDPATASIKLSFDYLPSFQLKKCFAYCAIFEEDEVIEKNKLIQLWMAQGLLSETNVLRDEQLGEKYYQFLLSNSLFQDENLDIGGRKSFKMHDVVHKLVRDISRYYHIEGQHLSLQVEEDWSSELGNNLRTLIASFRIISIHGFWLKIKGLRALTLLEVYLEELSESIGELKHLRYLDISDGPLFSRLPIGVANLYYLQTLRVPKVNLFPNEFKNLINLRHLWTRDEFEIPVGLGMLTSLQTLPTIYLRRGSRSVSELQALNNLTGKLTMEGLGEAQKIEEIQKVELGKKENIYELYLRFDDDNWREEDVNHMMMILEALEPHPNLASLAIASYNSPTFPRWMMKMTGYGGSALENLVSLELKYCHFIEELPSMKNLHALKKLIIRNCMKARSLQNLECLTSLQTLQINGCDEMENLGDISSLVRLWWLEIDDCLKMTNLPAGLSNLPNLKILIIGGLNGNLSIFPFPSINHLSPLSASLEELTIRGSYSMYHVENLPDQIQHLRALRSLQINDFCSLKQMPEWLGNLISLQELILYKLKQVETLPSQDAMTRLSQLTKLQIENCPKLYKACSRDGSEWSKIQNIPCLDIKLSWVYQIFNNER